MAVHIKTAEEIAAMREAGRRLSEVHRVLRDFLRPGITTLDIENKCEEAIAAQGGVPNFLHYGGFPASVCVSVNDEVVHGIPSADRVLKEGDVVSLDTGLIYEGFHSDAARTWIVGKGSEEAERLVKDTEASFYEGMKYARPGHHLYEISAAVDRYASEKGYGVVEGLAGHGIGRHLHEWPPIPNVTQKARGMILLPGMTIAVEPMITAGGKEIEVDEENEWTVRTKDGSLAAHYENTVLITEDGPELLTKTVC